mmetsp:Transcript_6918/g.21037  ORF Transcript_6918/g.21037 Transcript_6918/m.21037 type:complete len:261 (-) Transcript_6918:326-1108(-)
MAFVGGAGGFRLKDVRRSVCEEAAGRVAPRRSSVRCAMSEDKGGGKQAGGNLPGEGVPDKDFGATISKVIDGSFRKVWLMLLARGVGEQYFMAIQAFILGVMAAYKKGYSIPALQMELSMTKIDVSSDERVNQALELRDNEKKTRYVWIVLIYLALQKIGFPSNVKRVQIPKDELTPALEVLVDKVTDAYKRGFSFEGLKMELTLNRKSDAPELNADAASIRSQWMRIVYITNQLVASNQANKDKREDTDGDKGGSDPSK